MESRVILHERQSCSGVETELLLAVRSSISCADDVAPVDLRNLDSRVGVKVIGDAARDTDRTARPPVSERRIRRVTFYRKRAAIRDFDLF